LEFEKGYCLYRLNQVSEALKVIENVQNSSLKIKELKAQILYRLEKYEECFAVYRDIIKNSNDEYEEERETNLAAVLGNLTIEGSVSLIHFRKSKEFNIKILMIYIQRSFLGFRSSFLT